MVTKNDQADEREGKAGLRPYEFSVSGKSLRWYLKSDVDALLTQQAAPEPLGWAIVRDRKVLLWGCATEKAAIEQRAIHTRAFKDGEIVPLGDLRLFPVAAPEAPTRTKLHENRNEDGDLGWYFDCDGHYIDVERDKDGKYSVFFRNRADQSETWLDQADSTSTGAAPEAPTLPPDGDPWQLGFEAGKRVGVQLAAPEAPTLCQWPTCQPEAVQQQLAKEVVDSLYGAAAEAPALTLDNAPEGTLAPSIGGGRWYRTAQGWKWNGPDGSGGTFPMPGGDWSGKLVAPEAPANTNTVNLTPSAGLSESDITKLSRHGAEVVIREKNATIKAHQSVLAERDAEIARLSATPAATTAIASGEPLLDLIWRINDAVLKFLPSHPDVGVMQARNTKSPAEVLVNVESLTRYYKEASNRATATSRNAAPTVKTWQQRTYAKLADAMEPWQWSVHRAKDEEIAELRAALTQQSAAQAPTLMRQAVASVASNADGKVCVNWMRPERVEAGTLLYVLDRDLSATEKKEQK